MSKEVYVTESGFEDMKNELENLKQVRRPEVIAALKDAIEDYYKKDKK